MVVYSIADVEKLTGIKAHTLRVWEKRYAVICPKRTKTNIRYFDENDLKSILTIALLKNNGYKISAIAMMCSEQRNTLASRLTQVNQQFDNVVDALTYGILNFDEEKITDILNRHHTQHGLQETMDAVIYPLLEKISLMWVSGTISDIHERFLSRIIKRLIIASTYQYTKPDENKPSFMLYLPEGQAHELSMLYLKFLLKQNGCKVYFMGLDFSLSNLEKFLNQKPVDYVFAIINEVLSDTNIEDFAKKLQSISPNTTRLVMSGLQVILHEQTLPKDIIVIKQIEDVLSECAKT